MANSKYAIKISDTNNQFNDTFVVMDLYMLGQILGNLHGKYYNHYGPNYMRWISVTVEDDRGNVEYVHKLVDYSAKCYDKYYRSKR